MDTKHIEDIRKNWISKSTDELLQIWKENNHEAWSSSAFEAARQILTERGVESDMHLSDHTKKRFVKKIEAAGDKAIRLARDVYAKTSLADVMG